MLIKTASNRNIIIEIDNMKKSTNHPQENKEKYEVLCPKPFFPSKPQSKDKDRRERVIKQRGMRAIGLNSTKYYVFTLLLFITLCN